MKCKYILRSIASLALAAALAIGGVPALPGTVGSTISDFVGVGVITARAATPAPTNVKITVKKKNAKKVTVKASWSGSAPRYFVNVYNYYAGGYANEWRYTGSKSVSIDFAQEEGIPYEYTVQVWGHNGGDRADDNTYSKEVDKKTTYQLVGTYTKKVQSVIKKNNVKKMSKFEQVRFAHDWIIKNYDYDSDKAEGSFYFPTAFKSKKAVCEGYAKTFQVFMTCLGIQSDYVHNNTHGWNLVKLGGKWYHVDCTYDDPIGMEKTTKKYPIYDYFLQSTENLKKKSGANMHKYSEKSWPKASSTTYDNAGSTSGFSENIPGSESSYCDSTFSPWKKGKRMDGPAAGSDESSVED